jgi:hypothetical protein
MLAWGRAQLRALARTNRPSALAAAISISILLLTLVVVAVPLVPTWVTSWQGAHGRYPTGHLTYAVPNGWDTTTLTGLSITNPGVWWDVFDDQVTAISPTYAACYTPPCAAGTDLGARVWLKSAAGRSQPTVEAWYQTWANATALRLGPDVVLPLADYTRVPLGGQAALCAANQAASELLPPYPLPSPHFDATFAGYSPSYSGTAAVMCFALWQSRAYYVEVTVQLHTASQVADLRGATDMLNSLRFV